MASRKQIEAYLKALSQTPPDSSVWEVTRISLDSEQRRAYIGDSKILAP